MDDKQAILHRILGDQPFLAGPTVTLADISLAASYPWLSFAELVTPQMEAWYRRVLEQVPQLAECNSKTDVAKLLGVAK